MQRKCHRCNVLYTPTSDSKLCDECLREIANGESVGVRVQKKKKKAVELDGKDKKVCVVCGKVFYTRYKCKKTCCRACSVAYRNSYRKEYYHNKKIAEIKERLA